MTPRGPRRVLYVNSWSTAHGGSSTSLIDVVTHLDPERYRPIVMCPTEGELPRRLREAGIPVITRGMNRPTREGLRRFLLEVPRHWHWLRSDGIALVHGNTSASRRSITDATVRARVPYLQHVRNVVKDPNAGFGFRMAERIICNSDATAAVFRAERTLCGKTVTLYNAVDLSRYDGDRDNRRSELGLSAATPIVGFVGQIVPRKGLTTLIQAMREVVNRVPNAQLVIVGCPPPDETEYEAECRRMVERLTLSPHVTFVGYRLDIPAFMRTFDVFALPTRSEPFGKVIIEAMAAGCPVVASSVGGIPEIISEPGLGSLVPPDDPSAVSNAILAYLTEPSRRNQVGNIGRTSVRQRFGLDQMLSSLQNLYDEVLDLTQPRGSARQVEAGTV